MKNSIHVSVERHHKAFLNLIESLNASGIHREAIEDEMLDRGVEPSELKAAIATLESANEVDVEAVIAEKNTVAEVLEVSEEINRG